MRIRRFIALFLLEKGKGRQPNRPLTWIRNLAARARSTPTTVEVVPSASQPNPPIRFSGVATRPPKHRPTQARTSDEAASFTVFQKKSPVETDPGLLIFRASVKRRVVRLPAGKRHEMKVSPKPRAVTCFSFVSDCLARSHRETKIFSFGNPSHGPWSRHAARRMGRAKRNPSTSLRANDGYRCAPPTLRLLSRDVVLRGLQPSITGELCRLLLLCLDQPR